MVAVATRLARGVHTKEFNEPVQPLLTTRVLVGSIRTNKPERPSISTRSTRTADKLHDRPMLTRHDGMAAWRLYEPLACMARFHLEAVTML